MEQMESPQSQDIEITSFGTRAVNVLSSPGELFREVAAVPVQGSSWLIPYLVMAALVVLMIFSMANNPVLYEKAMEPQREDMRKQVAEGEMSQADADRATEFMEKPAMFIAFGSLASILFVTVALFGIPLLLWFLVKSFWKFGGGYKKILEVYGLSSVIGIVGTLVAILMMNMMDSIYAQPGGAFFLMDSFDKDNFAHNMIASLNIFTIWQVAVVGMGLSAVSGKKTGQGMMLAFGLWIVWVLVAGSLGWGAR